MGQFFEPLYVRGWLHSFSVPLVGAKPSAVSPLFLMGVICNWHIQLRSAVTLNLQHPTITITQVTPAGPTMGTNDSDAMDGNLSNPPLQTSPMDGLVNAGSKIDKIAGISALTPWNDANTLYLGYLIKTLVLWWVHQLVIHAIAYMLTALCSSAGTFVVYVDWIQHNSGGMKSDFDMNFGGLLDEELLVRTPNYALWYTLVTQCFVCIFGEMWNLKPS